MKVAARRAAKLAALALMLLVAAGVVAPFISAERYRDRIQAALEGALGRKVEIGEVHFNVFTGVGFAVDSVVIHEDPAIGIEPIAYVNSLEAVPRVWSLFSRKLEFSSIRLDAASINVAKTGTASGPGRWNLEALLNRSLVMTFPEIHIRRGRINFRFGDTKTVFYLTETDLDIYPPARGGKDWSVRFSGSPARSDRPSRAFGYLAARGRWVAAEHGRPDRLDLDVELERSAIGDITALIRGADAGIHGAVSSRMRVAGPIGDLRISGRLMVEDVHRWDLLPAHGRNWPLNVRGRLNLLAHRLELETSSSEREALPLYVRLEVADFLAQPQLSVAVNWNRFPLAPVLDLARHMGAELPERLQLAGTLDGSATYGSANGLAGELAFRDTAVTIPDSPPIRFEEARLLFDRDGVRLTPSVVRTAENDMAQLEAAYRWDTRATDLTISTKSMNVASLRSQVALAAVPWLEQVESGAWSGQLRYHWEPAPVPVPSQSAWSGQIELKNVGFPVPGMAEPLRIETARAHIEGPRIVLDRLQVRAGKIEATGEYRYEPLMTRPHRFRLKIPEAGAAEVERLFTPTLERSRGLLARAFNIGRSAVPQWLAMRRMEGTVEVGSLMVATTKLGNVHGRLMWDGTRARLDQMTASVEDGTLAGVLNVSLRGSRPAYLLVTRIRKLSCRSGRIDADGVLETHGMGAELLANLRSTGTFNGHALELGTMPPLKSVTGTYRLAWGKPEPRLRFWDLHIATGEEIYTGTGATQEDGRLLIQLSSGDREMRMSGTLAKLNLDEPAAP